jgi:hypothetical protein
MLTPERSFFVENTVPTRKSARERKILGEDQNSELDNCHFSEVIVKSSSEGRKRKGPQFPPEYIDQFPPEYISLVQSTSRSYQGKIRYIAIIYSWRRLQP